MCRLVNTTSLGGLNMLINRIRQTLRFAPLRACLWLLAHSATLRGAASDAILAGEAEYGQADTTEDMLLDGARAILRGDV